MDSRAWMCGFPAAFTWSVRCRWRDITTRMGGTLAWRGRACPVQMEFCRHRLHVGFLGLFEVAAGRKGTGPVRTLFSSLSPRTRSRDGLCQYLLLRSECQQRQKHSPRRCLGFNASDADTSTPRKAASHGLCLLGVGPPCSTA
jgi:hypothetical protein